MKRAMTVQKIWIVGATGLLFLTGCGGTTPVRPSPASTSASGPLDISVIVSPSAVGIRQGGTWNFATTVSGSSNTAVTWSMQEPSTGGAITDAGATMRQGRFSHTARLLPNGSVLFTVTRCCPQGKTLPQDEVRYAENSYRAGNSIRRIVGGLCGVFTARTHSFDPNDNNSNITFRF